MILRLGILIILQFFLSTCGKHYYKQKEEYKHYSLKESSDKSAVSDSITRFKLKVITETGKVIALAADELTKEGAETTLGNFVCDALIYAGKLEFKTDPDLIILNRGGLRINLPKGEIKVSTIFELMPFENELVMLNVSGQKLLEHLPAFLEKKHPFAGMKVKMENRKVISILINGVTVDEKKNYVVFTSDYLSNGGDNIGFLKEPASLKTSNLKIRDAIIKYCNYLTENKKQITPYTDGRFEISK